MLLQKTTFSLSNLSDTKGTSETGKEHEEQRKDSFYYQGHPLRRGDHCQRQGVCLQEEPGAWRVQAHVQGLSSDSRLFKLQSI